MIRALKIKNSKPVLVFLLYLIVSAGLQVLNGAYGNEFGGHPDEAGHYVTGLMVRDFLLSGEYATPLAFAERFYLHYPKVAFGHWPPFFYVVQAVWTIIFSPSRTAVLLLMATISAVLSCLLYSQVRKEFSVALAVPTGLLFLLLPFVQRYSSMLMAELLLALLCFLAAQAWVEYLQTENPKASILFGLFAALAILTKGNGSLLCLLPGLSVLLTGKVRLLRRLSFWYPLPIVIVSCAPFVWLTLDMVKNGWNQQFLTLDYFLSALPYYSVELITLVGPYVVLFALIGFLGKFLNKRSEEVNGGLWGVHGALILSVIIFHCFVPSGLAARHLITAIPSLLLFFVAGVRSSCRFLPRSLSSAYQALAVGLVLLPLVFFLLQPSSVKAWSGFNALADELSRLSGASAAVFLLSSDPLGDGMFVSAVAQKDRRPGCYALRTSKLLSSSMWDGSEYRLRFNDISDVHSYLQQIPIEFLIIDRSIPEKSLRGEQAQLVELVKAYPEVYRLCGTYPMVRKGLRYEQALYVYQLQGVVKGSQPISIEIDMRHMLDRTLLN